MVDRQEHPKPQFQRERWMNLNGIWQFEIDQGNSGEERGLSDPAARLSRTINVPFCPESKLSGIGYTDFMKSVWYKRSFTVTEEQLRGRIVLHFGAVDYFTTVYINGKKCGAHKGGYVSFCFDITSFVTAGENTVTVHAGDDTRSRMIPSGKQSDRYGSYGCMYTRTTGIWQTVWLEFTPNAYIRKVKYFPNAEDGTLTVHADLVGSGTFTVQASFEGKPMGQASVSSGGGHVVINLRLTEKHLWEVCKGGLYDLTLTYGDDRVGSYFGLRDIRYENLKFLLNGKSVFQRTVLDQGFYPDGIYTAPSDAELEADVDRSMAMGFNGARLHEKVFEERFLYHCDRKGYLVWGEYPNWGLDTSRKESVYGILPEWLEEIDRDFNHPALVGWCPLNETWFHNNRIQDGDVSRMIYQATKAADPTRPCLDSSGGLHYDTDVYDLHDYEQNPEILWRHFRNLPEIADYYCAFKAHQSYDGQVPFFVSEYGGIRWSEDESGWGYGQGPQTREEFLTRLKGLTDALMDNENMFGLCYTQLTDVEQEQNGLYTYDRKPKFDPAEIYPIFARKAAIEE